MEQSNQEVILLKSEIYDLSKRVNHLSNLLNNIANSLEISTEEELFLKIEELKARPEVLN